MYYGFNYNYLAIPRIQKLFNSELKVNEKYIKSIKIDNNVTRNSCMIDDLSQKYCNNTKLVQLRFKNNLKNIKKYKNR